MALIQGRAEMLKTNEKHELFIKSRISKFVEKVSKIEAYMPRDTISNFNHETSKIIRSLTHKRRAQRTDNKNQALIQTENLSTHFENKT